MLKFVGTIGNTRQHNIQFWKRVNRNLARYHGALDGLARLSVDRLRPFAIERLLISCVLYSETIREVDTVRQLSINGIYFWHEHEQHRADYAVIGDRIAFVTGICTPPARPGAGFNSALPPVSLDGRTTPVSMSGSAAGRVS